jgi:hypothetical protein
MTYRTIKKILDPDAEERYWRRNLKKQTWYDPAIPNQEVLTWCRFGWEAAASPEKPGADFNETESILARRWKKERRDPDWSTVRAAVRSAYDRVQQQRAQVVAEEASGRKQRNADQPAPSGPITKDRRG